MPDNPPKPEDYDRIARELKAGAVVPFLGSGASAVCKLPTGGELAQLLIDAGRRERLDFPDTSGHNDLARVASWFDEMEGRPWLWRNLREVFAVDSAPGSLHESLARLPRLRLIATTNYDDLIERAFIGQWEKDGRKEGRKPWVVVDRGERDAVWVRQPDQPLKKQQSNKLERVIADQERPIVFKMHGDFSRESADHEHYLITEEQYIDFLGRGDKIPIPPMIETAMKTRHVLFLGYGLRDWNVRVLMTKLKRIRQSAPYFAWAVVRKPEENEAGAREAERFLWAKHGVTIFETELDAFVAGLQARL